jgi:hypothetical protein
MIIKQIRKGSTEIIPATSKTADGGVIFIQTARQRSKIRQGMGWAMPVEQAIQEALNGDVEPDGGS